MKTFAACFFALFLVLPSQAQTTSSRGFRWYLAPTAEVTTINGKTAGLAGMGAGWIVNDHLSLGIQSARIQNEIRADQAGPEGSPYVDFWYSGLTADYGAQVTGRLRLSARALFGAGEAHWRESFEDGFFGNREKDENHTTSFVAIPGVGAAYNLTSWMQLSAGGGYRYVGAGKSEVLSQKDMSGFYGSIGVRFGRF